MYLIPEKCVLSSWRMRCRMRPVTVRLLQVRETRENNMVATLDAKHQWGIYKTSGAADDIGRHGGRRTGCAAHRAQPAHVPGGVLPHAAGSVSRSRNGIEIAKAPPENRRGFWGVAKRKESDQYFCSGAYFSCSASIALEVGLDVVCWRARICWWKCICGT